MAPEMHPEVQAFVTQWHCKVDSSQMRLSDEEEEEEGNEKKVKKRELVALRHPAVLSVTPCVEGEAPLVLNAHEAEWVVGG